MKEMLLESYKSQVEEGTIMLEIMRQESSGSQIQLDAINSAEFGLRCIKVRMKQLQKEIELEEEGQADEF